MCSYHVSIAHSAFYDPALQFKEDRCFYVGDQPFTFYGEKCLFHSNSFTSGAAIRLLQEEMCRRLHAHHVSFDVVDLQASADSVGSSSGADDDDDMWSFTLGAVTRVSLDGYSILTVPLTRRAYSAVSAGNTVAPL